MAHEPEPAIAAMNAILRTRAAPAQAQEDLAAFLAGFGVSPDDRATLERAGAARLLVYRALVHNRMRNVTRDFIPRAAARRGREALRADFEAFVEERAARSYYLRDVPAEFVEWVAARWAGDEAAGPWLHDLARYELLETDARDDPRGGEPPTGLPLALDLPLAFDGTARLVRFAWAVQRLPRDPADRSEPVREDAALLVHRDAKNKVRYLELTPIAAAITHELMIERAIVREGLARACAAIGQPLDDDNLGKAAVFLADLADRGIMLGAEPGLR